MELTLVLTHACNLGCGYCYCYCYAGAKDNRSMPEAIARRALEWALDHCGDLLLVGYFGGEPLIRWDVLTRYHDLAVELAATHGRRLVLRGRTGRVTHGAGEQRWVPGNVLESADGGPDTAMVRLWHQGNALFLRRRYRLVA